MAEENRSEELLKSAIAERKALEKRLAEYDPRADRRETFVLFIAGILIGLALLAAFAALGI